MQTLTPFLSPKFSKKLIWINSIAQLSQYIPLGGLVISEQILLHDATIKVDQTGDNAKNLSVFGISPSALIEIQSRRNAFLIDDPNQAEKKNADNDQKKENDKQINTFQESVKEESAYISPSVSPFLRLNLNDFTIAPFIVLECCLYIKKNGINIIIKGLETPGVFRMAPAKSQLLEAKRRYNLGLHVDFDILGGVHTACGLLKLW